MPASFIALAVASTVVAATTTSVGLLGYAARDWSSRFSIGKAAVMPFHRWLPAAMVAPTPVSALLHAVAVVKVGVFTILKVAIYTFGLSTLSELASTPWLRWIAALTIILGSLVAFTKDNLLSLIHI